METNWAAEHLQTIRTLMERSALYRRALAPVTIFVGAVGIVAAVAGWMMRIESTVPFGIYWMLVGLVAVAGALLLVRRQALKQGENFWSPPTRRVTQAMAPVLLIGLVLGCKMVKLNWGEEPHMAEGENSLMLVVIWTLLYGLALHAAGFFMPRGIRLFAWWFLLTGMAFVAFTDYVVRYWNLSPNWNMGLIFGASHLAYGIYLYFTERKNEA